MLTLGFDQLDRVHSSYRHTIDTNSDVVGRTCRLLCSKLLLSFSPLFSRVNLKCRVTVADSANHGEFRAGGDRQVLLRVLVRSRHPFQDQDVTPVDFITSCW